LAIANRSCSGLERASQEAVGGVGREYDDWKARLRAGGGVDHVKGAIPGSTRRHQQDIQLRVAQRPHRLVDALRDPDQLKRWVVGKVLLDLEPLEALDHRYECPDRPLGHAASGSSAG
jgi:hypothetical protein